MKAVIAGSAIRTCLGDGTATFEALLEGQCGARPLRYFDPNVLRVPAAYQIANDNQEQLFSATEWLVDCVSAAIADAAINVDSGRIGVLVGTGLRELRAVERAVMEPVIIQTEQLHFEAAIRRVLPMSAQIVTISNACSAGGHALALAQDLLELGEMDAVVAAATDGMTESMLAMLGRFALQPTTRVRPFDRDRTGVLLGEGAAAVVVVPERTASRCRARLLGCGMSCDAFHETAPDALGITRSIEDAFSRSGRAPVDVDLVISHGTGTLLNDPVEASVLSRTFGRSPRAPAITGIKGAVGHTSGSAALMNVDVAIRCLERGVVPPIVGLKNPIDESKTLSLVMDAPLARPLRVAQSNAFGFGGVNAVTLIETP